MQELVDALLTESDMRGSTGLEWTPIGSSGAWSTPGAVTESNEAPFFGCATRDSVGPEYQPAWQAYTIFGATEALPVTVTETLFAGHLAEVEKAFELLRQDLLANCLQDGGSDGLWTTSGETFEVPSLGDDRFAFVQRMVLDSPEVAGTAQWLTRFVVVRRGAVLAVIKVTELLQGQAIGSTDDDVIRIVETAAAKLP